MEGIFAKVDANRGDRGGCAMGDMGRAPLRCSTRKAYAHCGREHGRAIPLADIYGLRGARAFCNGALEICIRPANGWLISKTRKIAAEADSANRTRPITIVGLGRE